jgi:hypothetical protein
VGVAIEIVYPTKIWPINDEGTLLVVVVMNDCPMRRMDAPIHVPIILVVTALNDRVRNRGINKTMCGHTEGFLHLIRA